MNNAILDNCHVRVAFSTNDERTAKRVSDALGTATELRAMQNYAGHRLAPWLGHLMVSRQETARPLLTPGEIMQLPATEEVVLVSGVAPIRANKARYFENRQLRCRILRPPGIEECQVDREPDGDWAGMVIEPEALAEADPNGGIRREPDLPGPETVAPKRTDLAPNEFDPDDPDPDDEPLRQRLLAGRMRAAARQAALDPDDGIEL